MMSKLPAGMLILIVLLAGCTGTLLPGENTEAVSGEAEKSHLQAANASPTTIEVTGNGQVATQADLALVFVSVTAQAETADQARSQLSADVTQLRSGLRDDGIPDDAVTTTTFQIFPRYKSSKNASEIAGYTAVHAFRIEVAPERAGAVIDLAVRNGADNVEGVQFTLTDETRAAVRQGALTNAMAAARTDAEALAATEDLSITGVKQISTSGGFSPIVEVSLDEKSRSDQTVLEPGPVTVEVTVSVTYTAE